MSSASAGARSKPRASRFASRSRCSVRCQTFHSSMLSPIRRPPRRVPTASTIAADRPDHPLQVRRARQVVVDGLVRRRVVVGVQGQVVDDVAGELEDRRLPRAERRHPGSRSCRRRPARSRDRRGASPARPRPRDGRSPRRSCSRSATDRPSRCRGTTSGSRTARHGRSPHAGPRRRVPTGALQYSTRSRAASAPRVPRLTASIGSTPASRLHATNSSVPTRLGSIERHARSCRSGRRLARPDAILPVVAGHEVAARIADGRHPEPADEVDDVVAPAIGVRASGAPARRSRRRSPGPCARRTTRRPARRRPRPSRSGRSPHGHHPTVVSVR